MGVMSVINVSQCSPFKWTLCKSLPPQSTTVNPINSSQIPLSTLWCSSPTLMPSNVSVGQLPIEPNAIATHTNERFCQLEWDTVAPTQNHPVTCTQTSFYSLGNEASYGEHALLLILQIHLKYWNMVDGLKMWQGTKDNFRSHASSLSCHVTVTERTPRLDRPSFTLDWYTEWTSMEAKVQWAVKWNRIIRPWYIWSSVKNTVNIPFPSSFISCRPSSCVVVQLNGMWCSGEHSNECVPDCVEFIVVCLMCVT